MPEKTTQVATSTQLGTYELDWKLGDGAFGVVYRAHRKGDAGPVALKTMLTEVAVSEDARKRFLREIRVMKVLEHRNVVRLLDEGSTDDNTFYFVMEFCPCGDVGSLMERRGGKLTVREAGPIILDALEGLDYAHRNKIVHRDLKPQNILLADDARTAKVSDFGLAKLFVLAGFSGMTPSRASGGTPVFMPPEQWNTFRDAMPNSDIWSVGATLYNMLTGKYPRSRQDPSSLTVIPIRKRDPSISERLADVIDRSLANSVAERYQSAKEMREAVALAL